MFFTLIFNESNKYSKFVFNLNQVFDNLTKNFSVTVKFSTSFCQFNNIYSQIIKQKTLCLKKY